MEDQVWYHQIGQQRSVSIGVSFIRSPALENVSGTVREDLIIDVKVNILVPIHNQGNQKKDQSYSKGSNNERFGLESHNETKKPINNLAIKKPEFFKRIPNRHNFIIKYNEQS